MDEKSDAANEVTSTQKSLSANHDPGWNDPPKWAFSGAQGEAAAKTPTKKLNRRVAFPMNSATSPQVSVAEQTPAGLPGNLPPPPVQASRLTSAPHAPLLAPSKLSDPQTSSVRIDKDQVLRETLEILEDVLNRKIASGSKTEEVRRRLDLMKIMWKEDKLQDAVCEKVLQISKALRDNDVDGADKIHVSLIMEHAAVSNSWISGIRHMILELREKSSQASSAPANDAINHPYLLPQAVNPNENS